MIKAAATLKSLQYRQNSLTDCYGRLSFGPVNPGQGLTIGNTLRRILLNDLPGIGVIGAEINGVQSEFSTLPGIRESVIEIFLNLRELIFTPTATCAQKVKQTKPFVYAKLNSELKIDNFPYVVTAKDLHIPEYEFVDPNQQIATILSPTAAENFKLTLLIGQGRGYQSWKKLPGVPQLMDQRFFEQFDSTQTNSKSVTFPIDAIFMPIRQVNFTVQEHSVDGEYIYFEVWTNGSINPFDAVKSAAKVGMKLMTACLTTLQDQQVYLDESKLPETPNFVQVNYNKMESESNFDQIFIEQLELSLRAYNCLKRANILTLADLSQQSFRDLMKLRNFGQKSADEVRAALSTYGIELKED
ncbi:RNA polymerase alpha subunit (chloroplast) [Ostreococcus tauri]|uniref:DNA-directed RNA polymerase subunit alpha n=2 Tax=Ostreococcus tauri TaxID=70448 RepID=RPOA_OSTTA|nr:RNA polymerase alpha subunit [Ostreococcus tauri]Q0P3L0.1 RecName: Full=DNA-directed RNA polymerase subunit alpha; Short=PEP; AltName: Full=Plastid-encoded RNA polymerase subunit alpha; Short=RNA polymerase subunit alpha [Ostreococcus tauri]AGR88216.1 RNA polymerase alpha subunit [Ostreococcus tauri]AGW30518.1 RNA polymerase alpha subunit [Ostreococcus tauri]AGW30579.1 RNA polymerase alpha subunit [Ostreococcus tauri]AGW30640.1 RNA polymerase alpha subunit [Ostreococcus tauri]AGW30701.1 RN|eukprot:YP_717245.1 RpoA (chloroplast) [Ostreococcus tauri]